MKMHFLQSGSAGNCTLAIFGNTKILIDVGIYKRNIDERLSYFGLSSYDIDGILITHEHIDHIKSVRFYEPKLIYATKETLFLYEFNQIEPYKDFYINDVKITPLSISHDIKNGLGFVFEYKNTKVFYMTDTGIMLKQNYEYINDCDYIVLESNYDREMLMNTSRPTFLKNRIKGQHGHLSNLQCAQILSKIVSKNTKEIYLAHLSGEANTKEIALTTVKDYLVKKGIDLNNIKITPLDRYEMTLGVDDED